MASLTSADNLIQLRVSSVAQLFHTLDPFPFRERDLDHDAEDYIVDCARELRNSRPIRIVVHYPEAKGQRVAAEQIPHAFATYFSGRSVATQHELKELFRIGWRSLGIGITVLLLCLIASHLVNTQLGDTSLKRLAEESLLIVGWVANWRPLEIFLYDWWPLLRRRRLFDRLAEAEVLTVPYNTDARADPLIFERSARLASNKTEVFSEG